MHRMVKKGALTYMGKRKELNINVIVECEDGMQGVSRRVTQAFADIVDDVRNNRLSCKLLEERMAMEAEGREPGTV